MIILKYIKRFFRSYLKELENVCPCCGYYCTGKYFDCLPPPTLSSSVIIRGKRKRMKPNNRVAEIWQELCKSRGIMKENKTTFCTHLGYDTPSPCGENCPKDIKQYQEDIKAGVEVSGKTEQIRELN